MRNTSNVSREMCSPRTIVDAEYLEVVAVTRTAYELKEVPNDPLRDLSK